MIKIKNNFTEKKRLEVLNLSKHYVKQNGWNHFLFKKISEEKKISYNELILLFENGYQDILKLSFEQINNDLEKECKNSDLIKLPVHKRIRKIILNKINLMDKDKHFFKRTFYYLLIPSNYNLLTQNLYKTVDLMWHIAGDNSTDFNFYSKRIILAGLYSATVLHYINNDNLFETKKILDENLIKIKKIPKLKERLNHFKNDFPFFFRFLKI